MILRPLIKLVTSFQDSAGSSHYYPNYVTGSQQSSNPDDTGTHSPTSSMAALAAYYNSAQFGSANAVGMGVHPGNQQI